MHQSDFTLDNLLFLMYRGQGGYQDLYQPVITFLISRFTDQAWVLFGVFGILLGFVYSRSIWFLVEGVGSRYSPAIVFLVVAFALNVSFADGLNGVRFWTACHVFVFGVLFYLDSRNSKYLLVLLLTPLIHFSYFLPCALFLVFLMVRRYGSAIYLFFIASFLVSQLDLAIVKSALQYLPMSFEDRSMNYINILESPTGPRSASSEAWFLRLGNQFLTVFVISVSTYLYWKGFHRGNSAGTKIFLFGMFIYGFMNLVSYVPSSVRFFSIAEMLLTAALILFLSREQVSKKERQLLGAVSILLIIDMALGVRGILQFASTYLLLGNFVIAPFVEADVGLYEFFNG